MSGQPNVANGHNAEENHVSRTSDSDLKERLVTVEVGVLTADEINSALGHGSALARQMCDDGLIAGMHARLQGHSIVVNV